MIDQRHDDVPTFAVTELQRNGLLRAGGLMAFDNTLWSGRVADAAINDADTVALRNLNAKVRDDARVDSCLLTVGDGVLLARKR